MKKILLATAIFQLLAFGFQLSAQTDDPVVMEVGGQQIRKTEFMNEFLPTVATMKNVGKYEKRQALWEYVDLFANFRAKTLDARNLGFDTTAELRDELAKYRHGLAAPYLIDSTVLSSLLAEAYERNHYSLHAQHILVRLRHDATPEDTLRALKRINSYYDRAVAGEDFLALAREEYMAYNPGAEPRPNEGDLGYFTAFDMVYPFETAAYNLEVGGISRPVRSGFGYHVVKLVDKVAVTGKVNVAHIWLGTTDSTRKRNAIYSIYNDIKGGVPFEKAALRSEDRSTAGNGGEIPLARLDQIPPEYIHAIENLHDGEYSEPFFTQYGWHIVKLIHKDTLPPFESMVPYYKQKMTVDQRGAESRKVFARKARAKYGIVDYTRTPVATPARRGKKAEPVVMQASLAELVTLVPDSVMRGKWKSYDESLITDRRPLVHVPGHDYTAVDLARYIRRHLAEQRRETIEYYVQKHFDDFLDSVTIAYADSQLELEDSEFAAVVEEYRRGLMIFNYNDKMIWSKAIYDTVGFANFYAQESAKKSLDKPEDSIYFWKSRARIVVLDIADSTQLDPAKGRKILTKALAKDMGGNDMKDLLEKSFGKKCPVKTPVAVATEYVEMGHQNLLADGQWQRGVYLTPQGKGYRALVVVSIDPPTLKSQGEARGYYLNAYQNEVERRLNDELRKKYNVKINWDVVNDITY